MSLATLALVETIGALLVALGSWLLYQIRRVAIRRDTNGLLASDDNAVIFAGIGFVTVMFGLLLIAGPIVP